MTCSDISARRPKHIGYVRSLAAIAAICAAGCVQRDENGINAKHRIAIATLMRHPIIDQVIEGVEESLEAHGYVEGYNAEIIHLDAQGQIERAALIFDALGARDLDVLVALTTPMAQAAVRLERFPVVFAAVSDPVGAGLVTDLRRPEAEVTGASDAWPYASQLVLIREILPDANDLGVIYDPVEMASQQSIRSINDIAPEVGFEVIEAYVYTAEDVHSAATNLAPRVDAFFLIGGNVVVTSIESAVRAAIENKVPLFVAAEGAVQRGSIGSPSINYRQLGLDTGELAHRLISGERYIPVVLTSGSEYHLNREAARQMGISLPHALVERAGRVYEEIE
ncbi:MAG: ABC transporter substrate-binding protein [bacterium]|nr:ABC transporter substrate-binding protein [bacterium]